MKNPPALLDGQSDRPRLILLGASNLTRGISTVIETARLLLGSPLEILAALGHGRSYGMRSRVFVRDLPVILDCGIWKALETSKCQNVKTSKAGKDSMISTFGRLDISTFALITDIGNDIIYGVQPAQLVQWIEQCIDRLQAIIDATIAMTMVPIESIRATRPWQYAIVKSILYPTRKLSFNDALSRADELHDLLIDLAQRRGVKLIESPSRWYGFDPIHIRMRHWPSAWSEILSTCMLNETHNKSCASGSLRRWAKLRMLTPEHWWLAGVPRGRPQPAGRLPDGSTIALY